MEEIVCRVSNDVDKTIGSEGGLVVHCMTISKDNGGHSVEY